MKERERRYVASGDYALIGDCHASALVSKAGAIDWACLMRFDAGSVFGRLLDADDGGTFALTPRDLTGAARRYLPNTNVLETTFTTRTGSARLLDCFTMRPGGSRRPYHHQYDLNLPDIVETWRRGSVIGSWLLDLTAAALEKSPDLSRFAGRVSDSGEGRWTLTAALDEGVPAPVLAFSSDWLSSAPLPGTFTSRQNCSRSSGIFASASFSPRSLRAIPQCSHMRWPSSRWKLSTVRRPRTPRSCATRSSTRAMASRHAS